MSRLQSNNQLKKNAKKQLDNQLAPFKITKGGNDVNDNSLRDIIDKMVVQKLEQDSHSLQPFAYKHMCCVLQGISKQREKGNYWRKLDEIGP